MAVFVLFYLVLLYLRAFPIISSLFTPLDRVLCIAKPVLRTCQCNKRKN